MKKIFFIVSLALLFLAPSCRKASSGLPEKYQPDPELVLDAPAVVEIASAGGTETIKVLNSNLVNAKSSSKWLSLDWDGGKIYLSAAANNTVETRYATVKLSSRKGTATVEVRQLGVSSDYLWKDSYTIPYEGGSVALKNHKVDETIKIEVEGKNWINVDVTPESLTFTVSKNPYKAERTGSIVWKAGNKSKKINVVQELNPKGKKPDDPDNPGGGGDDVPDGTVLFSEDFEDATTLSEWILADVDGDGFDWDYDNGATLTSHSGSGKLYSASYDNDSYTALTPDNWVFTPAFKLAQSNNYVSLWVCPQDASYALEHYAVYVTNQDPMELTNLEAGCTKIAEGTLTQGYTTSSVEVKASGTWEQVIAKIPSSFDGDEVYIGVRHFDCTDMFVIVMDDLEVVKGEPSASSYVPAPQVTVVDAPMAKRK